MSSSGGSDGSWKRASSSRGSSEIDVIHVTLGFNGNEKQRNKPTKAKKNSNAEEAAKKRKARKAGKETCGLCVALCELASTLLDE
mmetsp:Transcript_7425/g.15839  ORF Transcript_7425/g.15839 Transcript_7425/m.15839 type:complete len:85 (-) Transcript_7425:159-413(-)